MTTTTPADDDRELRYAEKIAKLRDLIERAATDEEADTATRRAQELMTRYAISEEVIARVRGREVPDTVVSVKITYTGIFHQAAHDIGSAVAEHNDCRTLIYPTGRSTVLEVIGFSRDVERVKMLDASLQLQATVAVTRWWRALDDTSWMTAMQRYKARRTFLFGFARGLSQKLAQARDAGRRDAQEDARTETGESAELVAMSTELVLRDKSGHVDDWVDRTYGSSLRTVKRRYASGGAAASDAGRAAGRRADVGQGGLPGTRRELDR